MSVTYTIHSPVAQPERECVSILDPDEEHTFLRDGLVLPRRRMPAASIAGLRAAVDALVAERFPDAAERTYREEFAGQYVRDGHKQDPRIVTGALVAFPIADTVRCLLGPRVVLRNSNIRVTQPGSGEDTIWHTDYRPHTTPAPPLPSAPPVITVLLYLDAINVETGPLFVVPGSHMWAEQPPATHDDLDEQVAVCVQPGQVVLMNAALWHRGGPNHSPTIRRRLLTLQLSGIFTAPFNFEPSLPTPAYQQLIEQARARRDEPLLELLGLGGINPTTGNY
ncbi:phytanoyl-CoA dioxygenase family protein [Phytohabitans aurantiacus]|jgi:hypothetical protein|uniref:Phytanoyl-CoA dioxygenase n=1 Tax=Phytohabitans aurantiacus TaxID=3016789 RepID=A0ABQ5RDA8_9ACTN|nr:phytanoyl-CoA dioxygenase family protein [Phytohabitans aurantiacus]GLI03897.1 hypothetical protein Pa4123_91770 [Phytohabitans aurantiacus]